MKVISIISTKGGSGKTQAAVHLAWEAHHKRRVAVLDLDPTHQSRNWIASAGIPVDAEAINLREVDLSNYVEAIRSGGEHDLVFIDTPANDLNAAMEALMVADAVLVPVGVGTSDIGMLASTERQVRRMQQVRAAGGQTPAPAFVLINRAGFAPARTARTVEAVETFGLPTLQSRIPLLGAYQEATGNKITSQQHHYAPVLKEILDAVTQG